MGAAGVGAGVAEVRDEAVKYLRGALEIWKSREGVETMQKQSKAQSYEKLGLSTPDAIEEAWSAAQEPAA